MRFLLAATALFHLAGCHDWQAIDDPVFEGAELHALASNGSRLIAVGISYWSYGTNPEFGGAVWASLDGMNWERVPDEDSVLTGGGRKEIQDVVWTGSRFVAVGVDRAGGDADVAIWISSDGLSWQRTRQPGNGLGGRRSQEAWRLGIGPAGVIAIGSSEQPAGRGHSVPAAWFSRDGVSWSAILLGGPPGASHGQRLLDIVMNRPGVPLIGEIIGYDAGNAGSCGHWGVASADGRVTMTLGASALDLCGPTSAWQRYPVLVAEFDGYTYAVIRRRATDAFGEPTVHNLLASPPAGGWATLFALEDPVFANVLGAGVYDGGFALVGNAGDLQRMDAWIWRIGEEDRTMLPRVLRANEHVASYATQVTEFKGLAVTVGYELTGSIAVPRRAHGVVWYRVPCRVLRWSLCPAGASVETLGAIVFASTMIAWLLIIIGLSAGLVAHTWPYWPRTDPPKAR